MPRRRRRMCALRPLDICEQGTSLRWTVTLGGKSNTNLFHCGPELLYLVSNHFPSFQKTRESDNSRSCPDRVNAPWGNHACGCLIDLMPPPRSVGAAVGVGVGPSFLPSFLPSIRLGGEHERTNPPSSFGNQWKLTIRIFVPRRRHCIASRKSDPRNSAAGTGTPPTRVV